jgi:hypothetical protein
MDPTQPLARNVRGLVSGEHKILHVESDQLCVLAAAPKMTYRRQLKKPERGYPYYQQ